MSTNWEEILLAFLHDPPDKTLAVSSQNTVPSHESRRLELAKTLLGNDAVSKAKIKRVTSAVDVMASKIERLAMPKKPYVNVEKNVLQTIHPLSGTHHDLAVPSWNTQFFKQQKEVLNSIAGSAVDDFARYVAVWRLFPETLTRTVHDSFSRLPAETRNPDHTIWNHLDIAAAFQAATAGNGQPALLAFALGPVQRFIEASRSVRDLWSGSMVLSWLAFRSMLPVIEEYGPTALVYPALRGNPLLDLWLRDQQRLGDRVELPEMELRLTPSLPNRFLALVPWGSDGTAARDLACKCRQATADAWSELADAVRNNIHDSLEAAFAGWNQRWQEQIENYFFTHAAVVPLRGIGVDDQHAQVHDDELGRVLAGKNNFAEAFPRGEAIRKLARSIPQKDQPDYKQDHAGRWQYQVELVTRSLAAQRSIRHVPIMAPSRNPRTRYPQKCTLLGSFEQMGPDDLRESKTFWEKAVQKLTLSAHGGRLRKGEALCAVALAKRFSGKFLSQRLSVDIEDLWYWDTWTVAAAEWLEKAEIHPRQVRSQHGDWNGQWLHWRTEQDDPDEPKCPPEVVREIEMARQQYDPAPVYYAILKLDGDDLGRWLRGDKPPTVRETMHPRLVEYYQNECGDPANAGRLNEKRPVGPALHAAISTALSNFALHVVPKVVNSHHGTVIYSGGDDTLLLLPLSTALACALELRRAYMSEWHSVNGRELLMMGARATLSGGLVIVHAMDDLRLALQDVRSAEKKAKDTGKDALNIIIRRRSGEHTSALCLWKFAETVEGWVRAFLPDGANPGASDRWAYHLKAEAATLAGMESDAIRSEIRRQVNRAETATRRRLGEPEKPAEGNRAGDILASQFERYRLAVMNDRRGFDLPKALNGWITLCQTASFMSRGRDI